MKKKKKSPIFVSTMIEQYTQKQFTRMQNLGNIIVWNDKLNARLNGPRPRVQVPKVGSYLHVPELTKRAHMCEHFPSRIQAHEGKDHLHFKIH
jgi:hypothetical protein